MKERLKELLLKSDPLHERDLDDDLVEGEVEAIADHLLAEGVIVPPCKVGDTVYWLDNGAIKDGAVFEISIHSDGILLHTGTRFSLEVEEVFLAREEVEQALKEAQDDKQ